MYVPYTVAETEKIHIRGIRPTESFRLYNDNMPMDKETELEQFLKHVISNLYLMQFYQSAVQQWLVI